MMNLVIDIGNTHTKIAWYDQFRLVDLIRKPNKEITDVSPVLQHKQVDDAIISSVGLHGPKIAESLQKNVTNLTILDHHTPLPIRIVYGTPETLGHDRIAAAVGASCIFPSRNVMVADMGTAITIELLTSRGEYLGGNISPGLHTRFRALHEFTAKLPLVDCDSSFPLFGTDTRSALVAGVQQGIVFEINGYFDYFEKLHPDAALVLTGGDAPFFNPFFKRNLSTIPDLVLAGLNYILEYNKPDRSS